MAEPAGSLYERMGGESAIQTMVDGFYRAMDEMAGVERLRDLHQASLEETKEKLVMYFTGWFGGPALYVNRYGHPRLRARHRHVPIGSVERDQWVRCMEKSLQSMQLDPELYGDLMKKIAPMADHMRNLEGDGDPENQCP